MSEQEQEQEQEEVHGVFVLRWEEFSHLNSVAEAAAALAKQTQKLVLVLGPGDDLEWLDEREMAKIGWYRRED